MATITCTNCGEQLSSQTDPCPKCGSVKKSIGVFVADTITVGDALNAIAERRFLEKNWRLIAPYFLVNILSSLTGLAGPYGIPVGIVLNVISFFLGLGAVKTVVQRDRLSQQI